MNHVVHEAQVYLCGHWGTYFHRHVRASLRLQHRHRFEAACPAESCDCQGSDPIPLLPPELLVTCTPLEHAPAVLQQGWGWCPLWQAGAQVMPCMAQ